MWAHEVLISALWDDKSSSIQRSMSLSACSADLRGTRTIAWKYKLGDWNGVTSSMRHRPWGTDFQYMNAVKERAG